MPRDPNPGPIEFAVHITAEMAAATPGLSLISICGCTQHPDYRSDMTDEEVKELVRSNRGIFKTNRDICSFAHKNRVRATPLACWPSKPSLTNEPSVAWLCSTELPGKTRPCR